MNSRSIEIGEGVSLSRSPGLNESRGHLSYWEEHLSSATTLLQLPILHSRQASQCFTEAREWLTLPRDMSDSLGSLGSSEETTLSTMLLTAFAVLLKRYTGQDDILVGSVGDRTAWPAGMDPIGSSSLPLRIDLRGNPSFRELLKRVDREVTDTCAHRDVSIKQLVSELEPQCEPNRHPLFQVAFSLSARDAAMTSDWTSERGKPKGNSNTLPEVDIRLELQDRPEGIAGSIVYNAELFDAAMISRMRGHLEIVLQGILNHPDQIISRLPLLTPAESRMMLDDWNNTSAIYPRDSSMQRLFEAQAKLTPDAIAVEYGRCRLTYRELDARANQLAHALRKEGVAPEACVGVCLERSLELAVALLGVLKAGGACLPLDPDYPGERLAYMLEHAEVLLVVTKPGLLPMTPVKARVIYLTPAWESIDQESQDRPEVDVQPDKLAYVVYTSGSTGKPRGVLLTHRGLVNHSTAAVKLYDITAADRVLQFSSISFDIAIEEMFPVWISGGAVIFRTDDLSLVANDFLTWIKRQRITMLDLPTAYWHELVNQLSDSGEPLPNSLRLVIVGGEKASQSILRSWQKLAAGRVRWINTYGPSEASVITTAYEPPPHLAPQQPSILPIGRPIANTKVYVLDQDLNPVPVGIAGELHIAGVGLARGYLNRPELTAEKFIASPFAQGERLYKTGDVVRYVESGELEFIGRRDEQVKIRGYRVELGEVEAALGSHPGVGELVVEARGEGSGEKRLVAYVVAAKGKKPTAVELRKYVGEKLPEYMVPWGYVFLESLPLTANGKVDRRRLADAMGELGARSGSGGAEAKGASNEVEEELVKIWEGVLGKKGIGVEENFFELGGHSLLAVRLMHRIEREMGKKLAITALLEAPTVAGLAEVMGRGAERSEEWSSLVAIQPEGWRPPFFCVHGIGGTVLCFYDLARHLGPDQPVYGLQAQGMSGKHPCHSRVEDMAAHYLTEIRRLQPQGPYYVGGYSLGGSVALEMARQLRAEGEEIGIVALLDTFASRYQSKGQLLVKFLALAPREKLYHVRRKGRLLGKSLRKTVEMARLPRVLKEVRQACSQAARQYVAQPYLGQLTLFHAEERSLSSENPYETWKTLALGGLEVHEVPGGHGSIIDEPAVRSVAKKLKACLERTQAEHLRVLSHPIGDCESASNVL
jgi:amino acid adenylation domain-containing protein